MIEKLARKGLENYTPYKYVKSDCQVKLDANESPFDITEQVKRKFIKHLEEGMNFNIYPDTNCTQLRKTIAQINEVDFEGIVVGVGSDQIIDMIFRAFLDSGDKVLVPYPSFSMYELTAGLHAANIERIKIAVDGAYRYDASKYIDAIRAQKPKVAVICNPNSPTGNAMPLEDVRRILEACPDTVIMVDEAYGEFANQTAIPLTREFENLIIVKTLSKAYGLAGARVGYSISGVPAAEILNKVKPPFNQNTLSQILAILVMEDREGCIKRIDELKKQREFLYNEISKIEGIKVFPSEGNFMLIKVKDSDRTYNKLIENGIIVVNFGQKEELENCMRVSIGLESQNKVLVNTLSNCISR